MYYRVRWYGPYGERPHVDTPDYFIHSFCWYWKGLVLGKVGKVWKIIEENPLRVGYRNAMPVVDVAWAKNP